MISIGSHLSISKGFYCAGKNALSIGANTFQFFTRNPRGGKAKKLDNDDIEKLLVLMKENEFAPILAHAPYTLNMCSNSEETRNFARMIFEEDLKRLQSIPCNLYNFHPGNHMGQGKDKGIEMIVEILNDTIKEDCNIIILLETMSGKGTEVGSTFDELNEIINGVKYKEKLGVCLDTCHIFSAGYDIVNNLEGVIEEFDRIIGLEKLKAIHLNDSKFSVSSYKDRHEKIGKGYIGFETIIKIVAHHKLKSIPFFLETPNELEGYAEEIRLIKKSIERV
ncbi:MAG: deoxyribonuclease IV [Eubacteriaceae bacterium]